MVSLEFWVSIEWPHIGLCTGVQQVYMSTVARGQSDEDSDDCAHYIRGFVAEILTGIFFSALSAHRD